MYKGVAYINGLEVGPNALIGFVWRTIVGPSPSLFMRPLVCTSKFSADLRDQLVEISLQLGQMVLAFF
jgi:hypothetical protein